jgi:hypothetical protein
MFRAVNDPDMNLDSTLCGAVLAACVLVFWMAATLAYLESASRFATRTVSNGAVQLANYAVHRVRPRIAAVPAGRPCPWPRTTPG